ncbi:MAG: GNAT family N-acetyltransferase [Halieaceae bacterium]|jgi:GNAT superfamily N-acetyltransferase|uniref:GNAT family N-acetyltransferase n=1 Tax=Haliea alexandrii TaxID=2448162 RepID=UPI000F0B1386|nr:GNAT family N-acetyltransferase [Haliea alexandrii]MCR9185304.1 GNAT family N-acetyltransferase [Halieaceae bacterium]
MSTLTIRQARPADCPLILQFIRDLALYERALDEVQATVPQLEALLFGENPRVYGVICEEDGEALGFALYFFNFSSWLGRLGLYLEDLYVNPAQRGKGAGKALLRHLAKVAVAEGCGRFEWNVLDWNEPAIRFYESFGARPQSEWTGYRLTGEALQAFAAGKG